MKYITSTNTVTTVTVKGINPDTDEISTRSKDIFGEPTNTEALVAFHSAAFMPMKVTASATRTEKRRMLFDKFIMHSKPLTDENRKEKGRFILRTVKHTIASIRCIDTVSEKIENLVFSFDGELDEVEVLSEARLNARSTFMPFKVVSFETCEEKRRISFENWLQYSEVCGSETEDSE